MWKSSLWNLSLFIVYFVLVAELYCEPARYDGYKLLRIKARHRRDLDAIKEIYDASDEKLDFWREPRSLHQEVDIMVSPEHEKFLNRLLLERDLGPARRIIEDMQKAIDEQMKANEEEQAHFFTSYHNLSQIDEWMYTLSDDHPDIVSVFQIAVSYEGRPINCLKLTGPDRVPGTVKPVVFIVGGLHSREWLAPATIMFMANEMTKNYEEDSETKHLLDELDWYILPVGNVDGYVYTWESSRLWRKTRSRHTGKQCRGADPNRNWAFNWGVSGVSDLSCDETYAGPFAFSETEVRQLADFLTELNQKQPIRAFIDFHTYSQLWMTPYGYDTVLPENYVDQYYLARNATEALRQIHGTEYLVGSIANMLYKASGNCVDWAHGKLGIPYTYAVELRDKGDYAFLMPARFIVPTGEETLEAIKVIGHGAIDYETMATE